MHILCKMTEATMILHDLLSSYNRVPPDGCKHLNLAFRTPMHLSMMHLVDLWLRLYLEMNGADTEVPPKLKSIN